MEDQEKRSQEMTDKKSEGSGVGRCVGGSEDSLVVSLLSSEEC